MPRAATCAAHRAARRRSPRSRQVEDPPVPRPRRGLRPARPTAAGPTRATIAQQRAGTRRRSRRSRRRLQHALAGLADGGGDADQLVARAAVSVGVGSPRLVRWLRVRDVVNPRAPARDAFGGRGGPSRRSRRRSPARGRRRARPSRTAAAAPWRHLGGDVDVVRPAARARRGTRRSSPSPRPGPRAARRRGCPRRLPSARSGGRGPAGCTGAKPTPQLPITTVVTPCHDDGAAGRPTWPGRRSGCGCRRSRA